MEVVELIVQVADARADIGRERAVEGMSNRALANTPYLYSSPLVVANKSPALVLWNWFS